MPSATLSLSVAVTLLSQLSVAVALPVADEVLSSSQLTVTLAGQVIAGAALSTTAMLCAQSLLLPQSSAAVQVRVITFSCAQLPASTLSLKLVSRSVSQLSVAVALPVTLESVDAAMPCRSVMQLPPTPRLMHSTVASAGQAMTGAVRSTTVMV